MAVAAFDHVAIPSERFEEMIAFYKRLGFGIVGEAEWRSGAAPIVSVQFGANKINLHPPALWQRASFTLRGPAARPGCGDFCFVWDGDVASITALLAEAKAPIEIGPVPRQGGRNGGTAVGTSVYTRDPDQNLLEFIVYPAAREQA
ncbi:MAG TPA: VOC family protein [Dehalococcoidia bacterium]|jgi:catechol 2,3-dioxygenase-like lactoylglutathione lyase family enzyme